MAGLDPPPNLAPAELTVWNDTLDQVRDAGMIFRLDPNSLRAYVSAVVTHQRASRTLAQTDILIERDGKAIENPALKIQKDAAQVIATFAKQFRLNAGQVGVHLRAQPEQPAPPPQQGNEPAELGRWCAQHKRHECTKKRSKGRGTCHSPRVRGTDRCRMHFGAGKDQVLAAKLVREPTYGTPVQVSAEDALLHELWRTAGHVRWLGQKVEELELAALTFGVTSETERGWGDMPGVERVHGAKPHVLLDLYFRERKHLTFVAQTIIGAGLADRLIRAAETQGAQWAKVIRVCLERLHIPPEYLADVPVVVPATIRELMPGSMPATGTDG
jgi:hypothetical protein